MSTAVKKQGVINVTITTYTIESERIPKYIELFNRSLRAIKKLWVESGTFTIDSLDPGTYTLRLSLSSGVQKDETFDLAEGEIKPIEINIGDNSPHESHEWAYLTKSFSVESIRDTDMKQVNYHKDAGTLVNGKLWKYDNGHWEPLPQLITELINEPVRKDGITFNVQTGQQLTMLEISGDGMTNLYVNLPPANKVDCLVRLSEATDDEEVHPIDVTVSTDNLKAETLITLLTNGAIQKAKSLSNAKEAEKLLLQKMVNPVTAAIGGYFLLKIGELNRLHDWANNLANWFEWLPDGAIIHATQLLNKKDKTKEEIDTIRQRLLQAVENGLPVYSEGLRLLEKGLKQIWYHSKQNDKDVKKALDRAGDYLEVNDCSQETTTFMGISPEEPGRKSQMGGMATAPSPIINDVDDDEVTDEDEDTVTEENSNKKQLELPVGV